jgi:hypothetical protein
MSHAKPLPRPLSRLNNAKVAPNPNQTVHYLPHSLESPFAGPHIHPPHPSIRTSPGLACMVFWTNNHPTSMNACPTQYCWDSEPPPQAQYLYAAKKCRPTFGISTPTLTTSRGFSEKASKALPPSREKVQSNFDLRVLGLNGPVLYCDAVLWRDIPHRTCTPAKSLMVMFLPAS